MTGRVAAITGATSGIGYEIALGLARAGATTVVIGRGGPRVAAVAEQIARASRNPRVEPLDVRDLSERSEMIRTAEELLRRYPRLHVLVNNAGAIFTRRELTTDGLERTFALNVLAPFILTRMLGDRLSVSAPARVVEVGSAAHLGQHLDLSDLQNLGRRYSGWRAYARSKLALLLLTREFARRWAGVDVTVNAAHPGFVRSGFGQNTPGAFSVLVRFAAAVGGRTRARGAETPLYLATDSAVASVTGEYYADLERSEGSKASRDMDVAGRLFSACEALAGRGTGGG